jgi:hypothetical protein
MHKCHLHYSLTSHKIWCWFVALKTDHSFLRQDVEILSRLISATISTPLASMRWNRNWCKLKHAQTCFYCDQVTWLPLSRAIKSFRELYSHTTHRVLVCARVRACVQDTLRETRPDWMVPVRCHLVTISPVGKNINTAYYPTAQTNIRTQYLPNESERKQRSSDSDAKLFNSNVNWVAWTVIENVTYWTDFLQLLKLLCVRRMWGRDYEGSRTKRS